MNTTRDARKSNAQATVKVYLVEDSRVLRERVIESITENDGLTVVGYAETEEAALRGILESLPDAVILDIQLARGTGFSVLNRLASLGLPVRPMVIVFTNYAYPEYERTATAAGCDYFFDKSSDFDRVRGVLDTLAVERCLRAHEVQDAR